MRYFQGWNHDETLIALERMGLIGSHERTDPGHSRFEVPMHIWNSIKPLEGDLKAKLPREHPWQTAMRKDRY